MGADRETPGAPVSSPRRSSGRSEEHGAPEIFNTDKGCKFTSSELTQPLLALGVKLSMDGKERCLDNVFVGRLWRIVKYDEIYLKSHHAQIEAHANLEGFIRWPCQIS